MEDLPRHSVSVTGIVFRDDGRVLVIQRADDGRARAVRITDALSGNGPFVRVHDGTSLL